MADALHSLSLLAGHGHRLWQADTTWNSKPTRIEAIVMFIRLLGEENAALACKAQPSLHRCGPPGPTVMWPMPMPRATAMAQAAGNSPPARVITAKEYVEFVMRALRYSSTAHTDLSTTLSDAKGAGRAERRANTTCSPRTALLRAYLVYLSYLRADHPRFRQQQTRWNSNWFRAGRLLLESAADTRPTPW